MHIEVHSRTGNAVLGVLGCFYLVAAVVLLGYDLVQTWGAAGIIDRALQVALVMTALAGLFFIRIALQNLGHRAASRRGAPLHPEDAAVAR